MRSIGIDIGGTKTSIGIIDNKTGKITSKIIIPSKKYKNDKKNLNAIIKNALILSNKNNIKFIGIGVPELINNKGIIKGKYNFNWYNKNLVNNFPKNLKVSIDSDVRCHLRAEKYFGIAKNFKNFIYVNIGTGLSYAHYKDNKIYSGANGYAIHFASSKINLFDWKKNKKISLIPEDFYSGKAILEVMKKNHNINKQKKLLNNIADSLASLIGSLINTIDPANVIFGGGVVINNLYFKKMLIKYTRNYILADEVKKIKILTSKLKDNTGLLGAGLLFK